MSNQTLFDKNFQKRLIQQIITESKFGQSIIPIIHPSYFDDEDFKLIIQTIKKAYQDDEVLLTFPTLKIRLSNHGSLKKNAIKKEKMIALINNIEGTDTNDFKYIQETAMTFCKQQELKKAVVKVSAIIDTDDVTKFYECQEIMKEALEKGEDNDDNNIDVFHDLSSVLDEDFRQPIPTGISGMDASMGGGLSKGELGVVLAPYGVGKAQPLFSKILTPNGWTTMGELKVGDQVIGGDGKPTNVIGVYPQGIRPTYKVSFNDGTSTLCDEEHLWAVNTINQRYRATKKNGKKVTLPADTSYQVMSTKDMIGKVKVWGGRLNNFKVPIIQPVQYSEKKLIIDPYVLGLMLGDGSFTDGNQPTLTTKDVEIVESLRENYGDINVYHDTRYVNKDKRSLLRVSFLKGKHLLSELNLYGTTSSSKFIPDEYLKGSIKQREALLQGLVDSDGYIDNYRIEISTVSEQLKDGIVDLVRSLGGKISVNIKQGTYTNIANEKIDCKMVYRLAISLPNNGIIPSRLTRKLKAFKPRTKYSDNKFITSIEYHGEENNQCIMVDNDDHLYVTDDYIVTHNTTILTKIANTAKNEGHNVLQIFFEDMPKVIQRKHLSCWSGVPLNELASRIDEVMAKANIEMAKPGQIILRKMSSHGTTMPMIKQAIKKLIANGTKLDMVILDYIDVVEANKQFKDEYSGEGLVMRQFESMLSELNLVGWTAVQGNRSSISAEVIDGTNMGGSIKKGQIGHFIVGVAKTLEQKEAGTATLSIIKSRFGRDGIVFEDCKFDNGTVSIDTNVSGGLSFGQRNDQKQNEINNIIASGFAKKSGNQ